MLCNAKIKVVQQLLHREDWLLLLPPRLVSSLLRLLLSKHARRQTFRRLCKFWQELQLT